ncbi:hypothetical protein EGM87_16015 [Sphingobium sp. RSMS]|uniref:hypothetical protein n=1 Tax=Sphingobium sp. RSMS TaxID=520734 RepID=UPI0010F5AE1D|nr:hypothetical protein [Sphingobium sp. RSMS]UXC90518.1 hypothetical protein EGM87_16015 [Sphingobium sp. RSMS]
MHGSTSMDALGGPEGLSARRDARTFGRSMLLLGSPMSPEASALVTAIVNTVVCPFKARQGQLRTSSVRKYHEITGPFLTDLLDAARANRWSQLATNTNALPSYPGGSEAFKAMRAAMADAGLLNELGGYRRSFEQFGEIVTVSQPTSFRPSSQLLKLAGDHGVRLEDFEAHFRPSKAKKPVAAQALEARAAKGTKKDKAKRLPVDPRDPKAAAILGDLERLNGFLLEDGRVSGIAFAGIRRIFSDADQPGFDWQWHGRFYSMPGADAYENMEGGSEARAKVIRIDGKAVVEVDISAAHLTVLHGLLHLPFDPSQDPYDLPGVDRDRVKRWLTLALGASDPQAGGWSLRKPRAAGLGRYPFLGDLPTIGISSLDLQYHEAEIMRRAMLDLMDNYDIGFLPVHDALMVAKGNEEIAAQAIRKAFQGHFEALGLPAILPRVR